MPDFLNSDDVTRLFMDCLFNDGEPTDDAVVVEGIVNKFGFHPERLASHREAITAMLSQLPTQFMRSGGGGWSFLQACDDRHGRQWTGLHAVMEQLFCLGLASGLVELSLPRELWPVAPGGMPYYEVLL